MRIAITGASGLLGGNLAALLLARGDDVRAIRRATTKTGHLDHLPLDWRIANIRNEQQLAEAFIGVDAVFHCAGAVAQSRWLREEHVEVNIEGTRAVLAAARSAHVPRVVHCSSTVACALATDLTPVDETRPWNMPDLGFTDGYTLSKRRGEDIARAAIAEGLDVVIVNPGYMFGPLDRGPSSGQTIVAVARGQALAWPGGTNCFVDVRDVAAGMIMALERGNTGERYILGGENLSYAEIFRTIAEVAGVRPPPMKLPHAVALAAGLAGDAIERVTGKALPVNSAVVRYGFCGGMRFSSQKAKAELGYKLRPIREAIADAIAWFRQVGMLG